VLAVGLYMMTFDGGFADDPVGRSRQAGATVGCWIVSRISVFSKLEFSPPGKLLCLCADISRAFRTPFFAAGQMRQIDAYWSGKVMRQRVKS
jgi:hypothetical protein